MKRFFVLLVICLGCTFLACQETKEVGKHAISSGTFLKTVGEKIPFETGMEWIEFYSKKNNSQGRLGTLSYRVTAARIDTLTRSVTDLTGVAFHYGYDDLGTKHIILVPVDASLDLWSEIPGRVFIDANSGEEISQEIAFVWADRFREQHPNEIWFHFFGQHVFNEVQLLPFFNAMDIQPAINVMNLTPQLLLVIWEESLTNGRINGSAGGVMYDASNPCPPCAME